MTGIITPALCGNCAFGQTIKEDLKVVECRGMPPTPVIMGMGPQGPAIGLLRARMDRAERACALYARVQAPASSLIG